MISSQAATIPLAIALGSTPSSMLASAAAFFTWARDQISSGTLEIGVPVIGKFSTALRVCTP